MRATAFCIILLLVAASVFLAGCTGQQAQSSRQTATPGTMAAPVVTTSSDTIRVASTALGDVLVDSAGKTLYYFANDIPGSGTSACSVQCATNWPVFNPGTIRVSPPLKSEDFRTITRADGSSQTTYNGWPLYYYRADMNPGDMKGESALNVWYVMKPNAAVMIAHTPALGSYLTDKSGRTLYVYAKDDAQSTTCSGACLTKWPPFSAAAVNAPSVLKGSDFSGARRTDGVMQTAYKDRLLYYYFGDLKSGDANGQGVNGAWYVANISELSPSLMAPMQTSDPVRVMTIDYSDNSYRGDMSRNGNDMNRSDTWNGRNAY